MSISSKEEGEAMGDCAEKGEDIICCTWRKTPCEGGRESTLTSLEEKILLPEEGGRRSVKRKTHFLPKKKKEGARLKVGRDRLKVQKVSRSICLQGSRRKKKP